jgi:hypothetical protein
MTCDGDHVILFTTKLIKKDVEMSLMIGLKSECIYAQMDGITVLQKYECTCIIFNYYFFIKVLFDLFDKYMYGVDRYNPSPGFFKVTKCHET